VEGWKNMDENVKKTADKMVGSGKTEEEQLAEKKAEEMTAAFEEKLWIYLLMKSWIPISWIRFMIF
jgi:hypothetical protein